MLASIRSKATFANICSFLALTIVVSMGTAYANNTVRSRDIVDGQVKAQDLAANSVTSSKIADGTIAVGDLGANSVGSGQLQTNSVGATEIADATIDSGEIIDNSLLAADLGSGSVGASEVADSSLTGTDIVNSSLTGSDIASNSISTADLVGTDASGGISLGAGAVAVGRCTNFSIAVPGALTDQTVIISARDTLVSGVILYGVGVPSNDTVTMAVCNFTGGTFPALSSFPIRTVTFG